ncbi:MAG TPA: hypothetical protein VH301_03635 [Usitatibacter sp.]|nr:hypothetical protein [Usitatibacter sp.]
MPRTLCRTCANSLVRGSGEERRGLGRTCRAGVELNALSGQCESYVRDPGLPPNVLSIRMEMPLPRPRH